MVNCLLLMVSALRGVPPVSFQPGKQLCRHSSPADGGLSLGPPSRKPLKAWAGAQPSGPLFFGHPPSNRDIGKHLLSKSGSKIIDPSWTTPNRRKHNEDSRFHACLGPRDGLQRASVCCAKDPGRLRKGRNALGSNQQEVLEGNVVSCGAKERGGSGACRSSWSLLRRGQQANAMLNLRGGTVTFAWPNRGEGKQ